jgi:glycerophosphoryl diester phosphodiesterase
MLLMGHRGARHEAPENTLEGFVHLKNLDIQSLEFDLRLSKDQQLVIIHDDTIDRTTSGTGLVSDLSAAELKQHQVPTLKEVLEIYDELEHAQLEVKEPKPVDHKIICEEIENTLNALNIVEQCVITSFDLSFLESAKKYVPHIKRGHLHHKPENPLEKTKELDCCLLAIYWEVCTKELIEEAHSKGIEVSAWTVNKEDAFLKLQSWGIDSIITDIPTAMLPLVK